MFGIDSAEMLLIIVVAVVVIGPKDLPRALYKFGQLVGKGRDIARHFRTGLDAMVREAELEELQKKWAAENARIMAEHPQLPAASDEPHGVTAGAALAAPVDASAKSADDAPAGHEPAGNAPVADATPSLPAVTTSAEPRHVTEEAAQPQLPLSVPNDEARQAGA